MAGLTGAGSDEVADHLGAIDPAPRIGAQGVDDGLIGDLHALGADVEHDNALDDGGQP
jgi:hypothetical protein